MTTPNEELITYLRSFFIDENVSAIKANQIANALQSQAERIKELETDNRSLAQTVELLSVQHDEACAELAGMTTNTATDRHLVDLANDTATRLLKERDTLRAQLADAELHTKQVERGLDKATAQLAEIEKVEPVAKLKPCREGWFIDLDNPPPLTGETIELFTHPMPAESKDAERYRWLRDYLISPSTHFDDLIVSADKADTLDGVIDAAITKGVK